MASSEKFDQVSETAPRKDAKQPASGKPGDDREQRPMR